MTYEDQLGSIVTRISTIQSTLIRLEDEQTTINVALQDVYTDLNRLRDDLQTLRNQLAQPGGQND